MKYLFLVILVSCATVEFNKYDYIVLTHNGSYLCDEYTQSPYGLAAKNCENRMTGKHVDFIVNPLEVTTIRE